MRSEAVILVAGRAAQALLTIASFRLLTSLISPSEVGAFYLIMSMGSLFGMFLLNPVGMYLNRKLFLWYDQKTVYRHFLGYNLYTLVVACLAFCCVLLAQALFGVGAGLPPLLFAFLVAAYVYVVNWNQNLIPALNAFGHKKLFVVLTLATLGLGLGCSVLFAWYFAGGAVEWVSGQVVAMGLVTVLSAYLFRRRVPEPAAPFVGGADYAKKETLRAVADFALPLSGATFFMWAQAQSYRLIVEKLISAEFLAYMAVGFSIATSVAGILESLVQQLYLPVYYRKISGGSQEARQQALAELAEKSIPVYIIYLLFILGAAEYLVRLLVDVRYRDVFVYARVGAFIEFFRMTTNILASAAHSEMRTKALIKPYLAGGLCAVTSVGLAAVSSKPGVYIPLALALSGGGTLLAMRWAIVPLITFHFPLRSALLPFFSSLVFLPFIFVPAGGFYRSLVLLLVCGTCFAVLQYTVSRRWLESSGKPAAQDLPAETDPNLSPPEQDI